MEKRKTALEICKRLSLLSNELSKHAYEEIPQEMNQQKGININIIGINGGSHVHTAAQMKRFPNM